MSYIKDKKEILEEFLIVSENKISELEIWEKYFQQKVILAKSGSKVYELQLGQTQREIKEFKDRLDFLRSYKKELK